MSKMQSQKSKYSNEPFRSTPESTKSERRSPVECAKCGRGHHERGTFPPDLVEPGILAGCPNGGTVLDPFGGAGTTGLVADRLGRDAILIELNPDYADLARHRIQDDAGLFSQIAAD